MPNSTVYPALTVIRTGLFYLLSFCVFVPFAFFLPLLFAPRKFGWPVYSMFLWVQLWLLKVICGMSYQIHGQEDLPDGPYLVASAHESMWETIFFQLIFGDPAMLAKKELFNLFLIGSIMQKIGHVSIDRKGSPDSMLSSMKKAVLRSNQGRNVLIFPGGTREIQTDPEIKAGVTILYRKLNCPCVPVTINSGKFWPSGSLLKHPGVINVRIKPTIQPGLKSSVFVEQLVIALKSD